MSEIAEDQVHAHVSDKLQLLWTTKKMLRMQEEGFGCSGPQLSLGVTTLKIRVVLIDLFLLVTSSDTVLENL